MRKNVVADDSHLSLDELDAENRYLLEPAHELTAKKMFDRRWAITVLDQAMAQLRDECIVEQQRRSLQQSGMFVVR